MIEIVRTGAWFALTLALPCFAQNSGQFQSWPVKPIRLIVPFAPGGPTDVTARLVGQKLTESLGQQVIVDNRSGAGGNLGTALAAKSVPDGYTALLTVNSVVVNMSLYANAGYDVVRDLVPVAMVATQPHLIVVNSSVRAKSLADLLSLAKTTKLALATPGSGTSGALTGEVLFNVLGKVDMTVIHFRGAAPAITALLAGEPSVGSMAIAAPLPHVRSGKLRALAVSSATRVAALPEVPTLAESGFPSLQDYLWIAIFVPTGTSPAIVQKLNESVNRAIRSADVVERLKASDLDPVGGSPQHAAEYVKAELSKWRRVVRETGAKPD